MYLCFTCSKSAYKKYFAAIDSFKIEFHILLQLKDKICF